MKKLHVITGLPRAGTSLLSGIIKQNPRFTATIRSPIEDLCARVIRCASGEFASILTPDVTAKLQRGMFESFYSDHEVAFDNNRAWLLRDDLLRLLYPDHKVIIMVRDMAEILNSFEHVHKANPTYFTRMYGEEYNRNVFTRCGVMLGDGGSIMEPWRGLKQYMTSTDNYMLVEYNDLAGNPTDTMRKIYSYLEEDSFKHDFDNVEMSDDSYDFGLLTPGLHTVRRKVELIKDKMIIPDTILEGLKRNAEQSKLDSMEFWRKA